MVLIVPLPRLNDALPLTVAGQPGRQPLGNRNFRFRCGGSLCGAHVFVNAYLPILSAGTVLLGLD